MARLDMNALCQRAEPNFWSPRWYDEAYALLTQPNPPFPVHRLGEFLLEGVEGLTYGSTATGEERQILEYNAPGVSGATHVRYIKSTSCVRDWIYLI